MAEYDEIDRVEGRVKGYSPNRGVSDPSSLKNITGRSEAPTIGEQFSILQQEQMRTDELIKVLEDRISLILLPQYEGDAKDSGTVPEFTGSALAEQVDTYANRQARHNRRLQQILERINL